MFCAGIMGATIFKGGDDRPSLCFVLARWAATWAICHNSLDSILSLLRSFSWGADLQKTARTFLQTPQYVTTRRVGPGD